MTDSQALTTTVHHELRMRRLTVEAIDRPTPRLVRVTLGGPDLEGFRSDGSGDHVKVFFPAPGEHHAELPELGPDGLRRDPGTPKPRGRDYTPKHDLLDEGRLVLDIVLHDAGIGSDWARAAAVGDTLGVAGPRGSHVLEGQIDGLVLLGDETALPAISNFLAAAPPTRSVDAFVEVADGDDVQPLPGGPNCSVSWLPRSDAAPGHSRVLVGAAGSIDPAPGRDLYWIAAEAGVAPAVRAALVERGVEPASIESRGYWKLDTRDHQEPHQD